MIKMGTACAKSQFKEVYFLKVFINKVRNQEKSSILVSKA